MKIRCEVHLGGETGRLVLVPKPEEKIDHLALKLAAFTMFLPFHPIVDPSSNHSALLGMDIKPDVFFLKESGEIDTWIECGEVSINKVDKLTRRLTGTRIIVLKSTLAQARRLRDSLDDEIRHGQRVEIWTWPNDEFKAWLSALEEKTEIFGEAHEKSFNLVVNNIPVALDLLSV